MGKPDDYYVYVYIDPRNYEEFYFGQGSGSRKSAHLFDRSDSKKTYRIAEIRKAGLDPIIRVIARDLSKNDALLVEKTLLWKLGKGLTNVSSGHYADSFRPHDTLHMELSGFDYQSGIYFYNIGEGPHRCWDDYLEFGFISAGQGNRWCKAMLGFRQGDVVAAYLKRHGFVGIGQVISPAKPIRDVVLDGVPLLSHKLRRDMASNSESDDKCEYVALVKWIKTTDRSHAYKKPKKDGIYTPQHVRASLDGQPRTVSFLEESFGLSLRDCVL